MKGSWRLADGRTLKLDQTFQMLSGALGDTAISQHHLEWQMRHGACDRADVDLAAQQANRAIEREKLRVDDRAEADAAGMRFLLQ